MEDYTGGMAYPEERVKGRLQAVGFSKDRQVIHKGFIEQSLQNNSNLPEKVSFAYVDFDFYEPIKTGLEFLHNVTSKGSIVIIDDYDFFSTGAKTAVDEFVQEKNSNTPIYDCIIPSTNYGHFAILTRLSD
jgi:deoxyxylulose-5-phosphate synthase